MAGLLQRRGVLGVVVIALGALLVLAVNAISGRDVPGVARPGPPPPLPEPNTCLQVRGTHTWTPTSCFDPYRAVVITSWSSTDPAEQRTVKNRRCATQTLASGDGAAHWPPSGARTTSDPAPPFVVPTVPWTAMTVSGGGSSGWTSCVMVAWPFDRTRDTPVTALAEFAVPAGDITTMAQLPSSLRRCYAGAAAVTAESAGRGSDDRVACTRPHQWELIAETEGDAQTDMDIPSPPTGSMPDRMTGVRTCRDQAAALVGDTALFTSGELDAVIIENLGDGSISLAADNSLRAGQSSESFANPTDMPTGCYLRTRFDRFVAASLLGLGERPIPYVPGR